MPPSIGGPPSSGRQSLSSKPVVEAVSPPSSPVARSLIVAAAIVALGFVGSRLLGVLRTIAIAGEFGTGDDVEAYFVAFRLPDLIFQVLAGAAIGSAFIPTLTRYFLQRGDDAAWLLASRVLNVVALLTLILGLAAFVTAPWVVPLLAPGVGETAAERDEFNDLAVELTRIMTLSPILFSISGLFMGILNARHSFFLPALAPIFYNLSIIFGALVLSGPFGVHGLAWGVVIGAALHLLVQVPGLRRQRMRWSPSLHYRDEGVLEVARLMGPRIIGLGAGQANFFVTTFFASYISAGSISALNYAWLLMMLPLGVFGMAISTAVFPRLAEQAASGEPSQMRSSLSRMLRLILFLTIPSTIGLVLLREPIVAVLLERGAFGASSTEVTADALLFFSLGLVGHASVEILARGLYALGDTRSPALAAVAALVLNLFLSAALYGPLDEAGLAIAVSAGALLNAALHYQPLRRRLGGLEGAEVVRSLARMVAPCVALLAIVGGAILLFSPLRDGESSVEALVLLLLTIGAGAFVYLLTAVVFGQEEVSQLRRRFRR
ncbi:MAG: murein biosynthesis integral membrane protein MurJ [Dehalococcoidia bacterium]|nr:murein biosynthesis integral membrane protein MurJ [Dehalococcoidia bacterium]